MTRPARIGAIGCGWVFDLYMATAARHPGIAFTAVADTDSARAETVGAAYGLRVHADAAALIADPEIDIVANFTPIPAHHAISRAALEGGKHVYSEKPLTATLEEARDLVALAQARGLRLSCAPSNALSPTVQTLWSLVDAGAVGDVRLVYAEFDDNPVYLLGPETWRSATGAPWPHLHEYEMGCTWEHAGYHLTWMCALFGPVRSLAAFSKRTLPDKTDRPLDPADTPDFSVATLDFASGVTARLTNSIAAPTDHRMRIVGNRGEVWADTYRDYEAPVRLERFAPLSLKARNVRVLRRHAGLGAAFGIGGRRVPLIRPVPPGGGRVALAAPGGGARGMLRRLRQRQFGQQDKCLGLAELAAAIAEGRPQFPAPDFTLHLTELTLAIQAAGSDGASYRPQTTFAPLTLPPTTRAAAPDWTPWMRPAALPRAISRLLAARKGAR